MFLCPSWDEYKTKHYSSIPGNNTSVTDEVINRYKTEYSSHALAEVIDGKYKNDWILVKRFRIGK